MSTLRLLHNFRYCASAQTPARCSGLLYVRKNDRIPSQRHGVFLKSGVPRLPVAGCTYELPTRNAHRFAAQQLVKSAPEGLQPFLRLMRLDRPIGEYFSKLMIYRIVPKYK